MRVFGEGAGLLGVSESSKNLRKCQSFQIHQSIHTVLWRGKKRRLGVFLRDSWQVYSFDAHFYSAWSTNIANATYDEWWKSLNERKEFCMRIWTITEKTERWMRDKRGDPTCCHARAKHKKRSCSEAAWGRSSLRSQLSLTSRSGNTGVCDNPVRRFWRSTRPGQTPDQD